jgi:hypothetical protein
MRNSLPFFCKARISTEKTAPDDAAIAHWGLHTCLRGHAAGRGASDSLLVVELLFRHACKLGLEGIVSKRKGSPYRSGRSPDWLKMKNPDAPAVKREAEEDWRR